MLSLTSVFAMCDCSNNGAGESTRLALAEPADKGAPQISHSTRDGWFTKVHRGQGTVPLDPERDRDALAFGWSVSCAMAGDATELSNGDSRLATALIAALRTVVNGGLMPHARQGGKFVAALAVAGSKLDGTGLENEHMGHIQVALIGFGDSGFCWKLVCGM
jgi:hypothetical protein